MNTAKPSASRDSSSAQRDDGREAKPRKKRWTAGKIVFVSIAGAISTVIGIMMLFASPFLFATRSDQRALNDLPRVATRAPSVILATAAPVPIISSSSPAPTATPSIPAVQTETNQAAAALLSAFEALPLANDGVEVFCTVDSVPKTVSVNAACRYLQEATETFLSLNKNEIVRNASVSVEKYEDSGSFDVGIRFVLDDAQFTRLSLDSDDSIYAGLQAKFAEMRSYLASFVKTPANIAFQIQNADGSQELSVYLPGHVAVATPLGDDPDHPSLNRSDETELAFDFNESFEEAQWW